MIKLSKFINKTHYKIFLIRGLLLLLIIPFKLNAQNTNAVPTQSESSIFTVSVNGKPMLFNPTKLLAFRVKEDGSVSISAQTSTDILNTNILVMNIAPADTTILITKGEYKILPEDSTSNFIVRAEYSSISNGNSSYWWSDANRVKMGQIIIDLITTDRIKGRFSFTGVLEKEDGSMDLKNLVKITNGIFDLPLETRSRIDPR